MFNPWFYQHEDVDVPHDLEQCLIEKLERAFNSNCKCTDYTVRCGCIELSVTGETLENLRDIHGDNAVKVYAQQSLRPLLLINHLTR